MLEIDKLGFAQRQRLTYIESVAYWEGAVDRPRISTVFGVTENHVTKDFRLYKNTFPNNLRYDERSRVYRPTKNFKPRIGTGSAEEYLSILRTYAEHENSAVLSRVGTTLPIYAMPQAKGTVEKDVLNAITRAISGHRGLEIAYQSMTSAETSTRRIWPHALLFNGMRWHVRTYDGNRNIFIDLVLQRILSVAPLGSNEQAPLGTEEDAKWNTFVEIDVVPNPTLTAGQEDVVAREFGMIKRDNGWVWPVRIRECLAGYFIVLYRLDIKDDRRSVISLRDPADAHRYLRSSDAA